MRFTEISYQYCDGNNYKVSRPIVLEGRLGPEDIEALLLKLDGAEYFIPGDLSALDLAELQGELKGFPSDADHVWHKLDLRGREMEAVPEGTATIPVTEFLNAFGAINAWNEHAATIRLKL